MTEAAPPAAGRFGGGGGLAIGAMFIGLLALLWLLGNGERELHRSAAGFGGLVAWLEEGGVDARTFRGGGYLVKGEVGLRILPLHDTDLTQGRDPPETPEEVVAQSSEYDIAQHVVAAKIELLPTLVVLPKWRTGMRALGVAHRELLIPDGDVAQLLGQIRGLGGSIRRDPSGYVEAPVPGTNTRIGLHHPQTLGDSGCEPLVGTARDMLLGRCAVPARKASRHRANVAHFWLLSDPDLMNNHGLTRAGNAEVALDFVRERAEGQPVVLDLTTEVLTIDAARAADGPSEWRQFVRIFAWPFTMVWLGFAAVAALVLWRAMTRYGPVARLYEDAPRASRQVSIDAKARLLRLARHDRALLATHIRHRLQHVAAELAGPQMAAGADPLAVLTRLVARRAPDLAVELAEAARLPNYRRDYSGVLLRRLDRFEACLTRIRDEFGRAAGARG